MKTARTTLTAAMAVAVLASSALFATTSASEAHKRHKRHDNSYGYSYYQPHCFWKEVKVWDHYGYHWETVKVCK